MDTTGSLPGGHLPTQDALPAAGAAHAAVPLPAVTGEVADVARSHLPMLQGAALTMGAVLGTGVITLPSLAARIAGPASILSWLLLVLVSVPLAATFASLGARFPDAGGVATYVRRAFGARVGAMIGWIFFVAVPVGAPAASMMAGHYVEAAVGGGRTTVLAVSAGLIVAVGLLNARGVRVSGPVQLGLAALLVALIVSTVLVAAPHARPDATGPFAPHGWPAVLAAAGVLVWAFAGWEAVAPLAAEYRRPHRDVPLATAVAVVVIGSLYLALAATTILVLGPAAATSTAPLADLMALGVGDAARVATAVIAVVLTLGTMNAFFAGAAKLGSALGRDGALPAWLAHGSSVGEVPRRSLLVLVAAAIGCLTVTAVAGLELDTSMVLATGSFTLVYVLGTASAVRLLPPGWGRRSAVTALVATVVLAVSIGVAMLWAVAVGLAALAYWRFRHGPVSGPTVG
ncbi:MAG TPA: amino acid permease [Propionibacteriaceae bacterium]|nr:amino acid permease [Propionibacteriaceae bacterium]